MAVFDFLSKKVDAAAFEALCGSISEKSIFRDMAFHIAVSYYADTLANCEFKTFEDGKEVKGELYYMLNVSPNPNQNAAQFKKKLIESYFYNDDTLVIPFTGKMQMYVADGFIRDRKPFTGDEFSGISIGTESLRTTFNAADVIYFEQENHDIRTLSKLLSQEQGKLMAAAIAAYMRGNSAKYKLVLENVEAGNAQFAKQYKEVVKAQLENFLNADKAVYPQFRGQDLQHMETGGTTTSADVVAMRKEIFETHAQAFKMPLSMMTGNINNVNDVVKSFLTFGVDPVATVIDTEFTRKLYPYDKWKRGNFIKVDTSRVNHVSILEMADKVDKLIGSGVLSIDGAREQIGLEPLNTDYSKAHFMTKNYAPADTVLNNMEGGENYE